MRLSNCRLGVLISMAILLLAFLSPACSERTVSVDVDQIVAMALASPSSVVSYRLDYSVREHMRGEVDGERVRAEVTMDMDALIDMTNRKMQADLTFSYDDLANPAADVEFSCREFAVGEDWYVGVSPDNSEGEMVWQKLDMDIWEKSEMVAQQLALLEQAEPEYVGAEEVDGVACDVLEFTPDMAGVWNIMSQQGIWGDDIEMPDLAAEAVKSAKTKQWIARETSRLMKAEVEMDLHVDAQDIDPTLETGGVDIQMTGVLLFDHYNEPASIELPPEAIEQTS